MNKEQFKREIEEFCRIYPMRRSALMPALHLAQQEYGYLSTQIMQEVADILELPPVQVYEVASFYSLYHTQPIGSCHLQLCTNVSCMLANAEKLMNVIKQTLAIEQDQTTPDGRFTLSAVECLGACDKAPVLQINNDPYIEQLSEPQLRQLLDQLIEHTKAPTEWHQSEADKIIKVRNV
jgi:NADH-quinone oxidoreductase subunit E